MIINVKYFAHRVRFLNCQAPLETTWQANNDKHNDQSIPKEPQLGQRSKFKHDCHPMPAPYKNIHNVKRKYEKIIESRQIKPISKMRNSNPNRPKQIPTISQSKTKPEASKGASKSQAKALPGLLLMKCWHLGVALQQMVLGYLRVHQSFNLCMSVFYCLLVICCLSNLLSDFVLFVRVKCSGEWQVWRRQPSEALFQTKTRPFAVCCIWPCRKLAWFQFQHYFISWYFRSTWCFLRICVYKMYKSCVRTFVHTHVYCIISIALDHITLITRAWGCTILNYNSYKHKFI